MYKMDDSDEFIDADCYSLYKETCAALMEWDCFQRNILDWMKKGPAEYTAKERELWDRLALCVRDLVVAGQIMRLDVRAIEKFESGPDGPGFEIKRARLEEFLDEYKKRIDSGEAISEPENVPDYGGERRLEPIRQGNNGLPVSKQNTPVKPKIKRRPRRGNVTEKQLEALKVVGECNHNFAEAARRLNLDRKTVKQRWDSGLRNAGKLASKFLGKPEIQSAFVDSRGQSTVSSDDLGPAASKLKSKGEIGRQPKVNRKAT
jgi:predicted DNA-binding protein (UPF0251 family)